MTTEKCGVPRCRGDAALTYLDKPVCERCWSRVGGVEETNELRRKLKLPLLVVPPRPAPAAPARPAGRVRRTPVRAPQLAPDQADKSGNLTDKWWE